MAGLRPPHIPGLPPCLLPGQWVEAGGCLQRPDLGGWASARWVQRAVAPPATTVLPPLPATSAAEPSWTALGDCIGRPHECACSDRPPRVSQCPWAPGSPGRGHIVLSVCFPSRRWAGPPEPRSPRFQLQRGGPWPPGWHSGFALGPGGGRANIPPGPGEALGRCCVSQGVCAGSRDWRPGRALCCHLSCLQNTLVFPSGSAPCVLEGAVPTVVSVLVVVREEPQQAPAQGWGWDGVSELLLPSSGGAMGGGPGSCQAS